MQISTLTPGVFAGPTDWPVLEGCGRSAILLRAGFAGARLALGTRSGCGDI